jgi:hypothetical protein
MVRLVEPKLGKAMKGGVPLAADSSMNAATVYASSVGCLR